MLASSAVAAPAVVIERMQVDRQANRYTVDAAVRLAVPRAQAFAAATDYERLPEFNPSIVRSERRDGARLASTIRLCVGFVCRSIEQVMQYAEHPPEAIEMQVVPDAGDFRRGRANWRFRAIDRATTHMRFTAELEPAFWVPPLIGPYLIARELRRQARTTAESIERLANDYREQDSEHDDDRYE